MPDLPSPASPAPARGSVETEIWRGHTSQWVHVGYYLLCLVLAAIVLAGTWHFRIQYGYLPLVFLLIPLLMAGVRWWTTRSTGYELTTQRLKIHRGILNRRLEEVELYRIKDYVMERPLLLRLVGLGHISLVASDASTHSVKLEAVPRVEWLREQLRNAVQAERDRKRVRELDVDDSSALS